MWRTSQLLEQDTDSGPQIELIEDDSSPTTSKASNALVVANGRNNGERKKIGPVQANGAFLLENGNSENAPANNQQLVVANGQSSRPTADSSISLFSTAATLVSWAVGAKKTVAERHQDESPSPQHSDDDDEHEKGPLSSTSSTSSASSNSAPSPGVLDVLLLVRQSIQRIGQLSWGVRTSFHTSSIDEGDFDAFIVLCSIYQHVGVQCASDLLIRLRQHRSRLRQLLKKNIGSVLTCILVLQRRIVDEEKSISGMSLVYRRLDAIMSEFELEMDALMTDFKQMMVDCNKMKVGILAMPLQQARDPKDLNNPALLAYHSINALAANISGQSAPSSAILTHGEYMTQMSSQMDLHWNSIAHLLQSVKSTLELVGSVSDRVRVRAFFSFAVLVMMWVSHASILLYSSLRDAPRILATMCHRNNWITFLRYDPFAPPDEPTQNPDFRLTSTLSSCCLSHSQYNYDGFFRQSTKDLELLVASFDAQK